MGGFNTKSGYGSFTVAFLFPRVCPRHLHDSSKTGAFVYSFYFVKVGDWRPEKPAFQY
jgi:hypothetical protein